MSALMKPREDERFSQLVLRDRVHGSIYTSAEIFEAEMERIFHRTWLCLGHASEIPANGDFRIAKIGRQSVIVVRGEDGVVRVLMNRCRHRGVTMTTDESGNQKHFVCPYHGWAYENTGKLFDVPEADAYGDDMKKEAFGLTPAARVGFYRGFIFASLSPVGPSLDEHLGLSKRYIDLFLDASPLGEIDVQAGVIRTVYQGNWKFVGMDGYHPSFVHKSFFDMKRRFKPAGAGSPSKTGGSFNDDSGMLTRDLGNGHVMLDVSRVRAATYKEYLRSMEGSPGWAEYYAALVKSYGQERADTIIVWDGDPHMGLFPNMQLLGTQIRIIRPLRVDCTEVLMFPTTLRGVPDAINQKRLRYHETAYGPASHVSPDDTNIFERNQIGLAADADPWVYLARGLHRERVEADGSIVGSITDETTQRGQLKQWKALMAVPA